MKNDYDKFEIGILGLWHLGCIYATSLAKLGYRVTGYDPIDKVIDSLNLGNPPVYEPHLEDTLKKYLNRNLFFSKKAKNAISDKKYVFVTLDIPINNKDRINLQPFYNLSDLLVKYCTNGTKIIISSQIPVGTTRQLATKFNKNNKNAEVIYFPENLKLGAGFKTFLDPDRIVLGTENKKYAREFIHDFPHFRCPVLTMSWESAEMAKHALNIFLATNISFSSELGDLCELSGANMQDVVNTLKTDKRISPDAPINPGLGFAGGTLGRDIQAIMKISKKYHYNPQLVKSVHSINNNRLPKLVARMEKILVKIADKNIGLMGLTYKPHTNTLRRSLSLELAKLLNNKGASVRAYDPKIDKLDENYNFVKLDKDIGEFFKNLDMAILMTDWPQFKAINPHHIAKIMKTKIIFDTRNFLQENMYISAGFKFYTIGKSL